MPDLPPAVPPARRQAVAGPAAGDVNSPRLADGRTWDAATSVQRHCRGCSARAKVVRIRAALARP